MRRKSCAGGRRKSPGLSDIIKLEKGERGIRLVSGGGWWPKIWSGGEPRKGVLDCEGFGVEKWGSRPTLRPSILQPLHGEQGNDHVNQPSALLGGYGMWAFQD